MTEEQKAYLENLNYLIDENQTKATYLPKELEEKMLEADEWVSKEIKRWFFYGFRSLLYLREGRPLARTPSRALYPQQARFWPP